MSSLIKTVFEVGAMALVGTQDKDALMKKLTVTSTREPIFTLNLYNSHPDSDKLYIPRSLVSNSGVKIPRKQEWDIEFDTNMELRPEQDRLVNQYLDAINGYSPYGGIIKANTGTGKSIMAIEIAKRLGLKTLIIVPTTHLLNQWKSNLFQFTDLKENEIGLIRQDMCQTDKKVTIGLIHSLAQRDNYPDYMRNAFGFVVTDECHKVGAETFSRTAPMFNCLYRQGLGATIYRKDGMDAVFKWNIGDIVAQSSQQMSKPQIVMVPYQGKDTHHRGCVWNGKLSLGRYWNKIANSKDRTELVGKAIHKLYKKDKIILVLSDRIKQLKNLRNYLLHVGVDKKNIGLFISGQKELGRQITLATYGTGGIGFDDTRINALVFATPRSDVVQALGRSTRIINSKPVIVDFVDVTSPIMRGWGYARLKYYNSIDCELINKAL